MDINLPNEFSARIKYDYIVERLEAISKTQSKDKKKQILNNCFAAILQKQQKFYDEEGQGVNGSFYPFLRLFIPSMDLERGSFGIQIKTLGQKFVQALAINSKSDAAKKLTDLHGKNTNYGDIVYDVMKSRSPATGTLTVYEVNKYLDLIAEHFKGNERSKIDNELVRMLNGMSALDRKWLTRTILKKLDLGIGKKFILYAYNRMAWDLYNQCSRLSDVCEIIESKVPLDELKAGIVDVFKPIRPMLCERGYISQINQMLIEHEYYLETKMDGERCQLHVRGTEFKYFSRNCKEDDLTKSFGASGELSSGGLYSPYLYLQLNGRIKSAIFDGEMMVWDRQDEIYCKKAENHTAKHLKRGDNRYNPCFCIYDLIYLDGESLINKPYAERIRKLQTIIIEKKGALILCHRTKVNNAQHFIDCLNKAFESNEEGVVIKQADSKYHPGQREKGGWFKMKPDYENNLISDFDLLIIGGYYNDNKTNVDAFLLAVLKKSPDGNDNDTQFHSVCKIRNGLSRSQFREILGRLERFKHAVKITKNGRFSDHASAGIDWANANPDFWYNPKNSIVLQIKASELTETNRYRTTHSFRFPRVMQIRWDKEWHDACSLSEFQTFCSSDSKVEKLTKRHATSNDLAGGSVPKRRRGCAAQLVTQCVASTSLQVETIDNVCDGLDFCIVHKADLVKPFEEMVRRHGGRVVSYPNSKTFVIIVGNPKSLRAKEFIDKEQYNIATIQWLVRALGSDKPLKSLIKFTPNDMVFATPALEEQFATELDADDETDTEPMNYDNLAQPMENDENVDRAIQQNIENTAAQQDIFQHEQPDVSSSQRVLMVACDGFNRSIMEPDTERIDQEIVSNDGPSEKDHDGPSENEQATAVDPIYEVETQLMENELPHTLTNTRIENEHNGHLESANDETGKIVEATKVDKTEQSADEPDEPNEMGIFRSCVAYFYPEESSSLDCDITFAQFMFIACGGTNLETADDFRNSESRLTHIFVANTDFDRNKLKQTVQSFGTEKLENIIVIRYQWVLDCTEQKKRICDTSYKIDL